MFLEIAALHCFNRFNFPSQPALIWCMHLIFNNSRTIIFTRASRWCNLYSTFRCPLHVVSPFTLTFEGLHSRPLWNKFISRSSILHDLCYHFLSISRDLKQVHQDCTLWNWQLWYRHGGHTASRHLRRHSLASIVGVKHSLTAAPCRAPSSSSLKILRNRLQTRLWTFQRESTTARKAKQTGSTGLGRAQILLTIMQVHSPLGI